VETPTNVLGVFFWTLWIIEKSEISRDWNVPEDENMSTNEHYQMKVVLAFLLMRDFGL
jgi:hypothetical protein